MFAVFFIVYKNTYFISKYKVFEGLLKADYVTENLSAILENNRLSLIVILNNENLWNLPIKLLSNGFY